MTQDKLMFAVLVIGVVVGIALVIMAIEKKKGQNSPAKQQVKEIVQQLAGPEYTAVYAQRQEIEAKWGSNHTTKYYYYYALGFKPAKLVIIPLALEDGELIAKEPFTVTKDTLGSVQVKGTRTTLLEKNDEQICTYNVFESNIKMDRYEVSIQQKEEAKAYNTFIQEFAAEVNER